MINKSGKRIVSLLLALIMIFSVMPTQAFATEAHDHEEEGAVAGSEQTEVSTTPSELAVDLVNRVNAIVEDYGINADMTEDEIFDAMYEKSDDELFATMDEMDALSEAAEAADAADELYVKLYAKDLEAYGKLADAMNQLREIALFAASGSHKPVTGVTVGVSGATDNSMSNSQVTVTAKGSGGIFGIGASAKTATITVYNESGSKAKISFDWTASSVNQLKIDGTVYSGNSGSFEKVLESGESFVITITTAKNSTTNKLVMKNFACETVKESSKVTFQYDSSLGSITVAGAATETGTQLDIPSAGAELKATAANGGAFLGWIDADTHVILSRNATYTLEPAGDMTVKAIFTKNACFLVNGNTLYESLDAALAAVQSVANKTIILANSGILPAGNYTIPSGITLLIPYNDSNTLCTTAPIAEEATYNEKTNLPTVYRKLTMAEGAHITVNGAISLSARATASGGLTAPFGACSFIQMESDSSITVKSGGNLYAWGFIQGSGAVTVENGGTAYECFQVRDWRGGDNTSGMVGNSQRVFPMTQYYIQNIEVPMTLEAGAIENGYMCVAISLVGIQGAQVPFIGASGMFQINSGYIVKDYDENTGRLLIDVYGNLSVKSLSISMKLGLLGSKTINSKDYVLPINGNMTINMHSGSVTMTQDIALLPGAQLIIGEGATCTLGSGNKIFVYDYDQWILDTGDANDQGKSFAGTGDATHVNLVYPTSARTVQGRTDDAYVEVNGTADLSNGYVYTTASGANICGTGTIIMQPGSADQKTYQVKCLGSDNKDVKYYEIPITSAVVKNADGTEVYTDKTAGTYENIDGVWVKTACIHDFTENITKAATCTETGLKDQICKDTVNCGLVNKDVEIAAKGHTAGEDATCTAAQTCTTCGAELTAALGHDEVSHEAKAPTCTEIGWEAYVSCSRCDYTTYVEISALGHNYEAVVTEPTCTEAGYTTYTCSVCGDSYTDNEVAALGHTAGADATCVTAQTCTVCGTELVAALGHNYEAVVTEPTCTEAGYTTHTCSTCGDSYTDSEVAALGHNWEWIVDEAATVLNPGVKHEECSVCQAKQNENTEIPILVCSHEGTMTATEANAATCTEAGNSAYWYCSACQNYYSDAAGQHEIEEGSWVLSATGHTAAIDAAVAPTCTETGLTEGSHCSVCGEVLLAQEAVAALGHTAGAAATCVTAQTCLVCGAELTAAKGHSDLMTYVPAVAATCQKEGIVAHYNCPDCGCNFADADATEALEIVVAPIDPDNHNFATEGVKTDATCQEEGKIEYPCQNEGCEVVDVETLPVDPEGHVWDEGEPYKNHSCNSVGSMLFTCTKCGKKEIIVTREQHFRVPIADEIPATCTTDGMTSGMKCEKCDEFWVPQEVIPALGHDWSNGYPCQNETSACAREGCDLHFDTKQEHLVVVIPGTPATCATTGLTDGAYCGYCGEILVEQTEIPTEEHTWIVADMEVPATCTAIGHKDGATYCMICDYDADPIPMLSHEWMHRDAKKATYTAIGWNAHDYCLLCNAVKTLEQYESEHCEYCGENPEGYIEIPMVEVQKIETLDEFIANISYLELLAEMYAKENPGTDPLGLVLNYMRTAVANYTSGSWAIMAGSENKDFLKYVQEMEDAVNSDPSITVWVNVSGLKKLGTFYAPNGEHNYYTKNKLTVLTGHFFGTMDMTYYNKGSQNHADVGGWVGDLTDLLSTSDEFGVPANLTLEEKVEYIRKNYLFSNTVSGSAGAFGSSDLYADLEAFYFASELINNGYETGDLAKMMSEYYTSDMTLQKRVEYLLDNRLDGLSTRKDLRTAVYNAYTSNKMISTLEGTRNFNASGNELAELRKAVCYAFADEMCYLAGDYVEDLENPRYTVFDTETKILAPGVSQQISYATNADGKQIVFYIATADVNRDDVGLWVNYYDRDPGTPENPEWRNNSVPSSAQNAQDRYGDPNSEDYIPNFSVIASTNAGGYDMSDVATPGGLMVMNGVEWHPQSGTAGFFAILSDGSAYMGTHDEYEEMMAKGLIQEAIGGFGEFVVKDGEVVGSATYSDAPRTSVGITATGRVVIMCIDGRQAPFSSGASLQDVGYIMREAGCVIAINLDGGGSTTFVARQPGSDDLTVMNRPSDGYPRNVSTNLLIYSTAPSSTAFDHAVIESEYDYATIDTAVQMTAAGVSPSGNAVDVPEGATWAVSDEAWATISEDGVFTGKRLGEVYVYLMLDGQVIGSKLMTITNPDQLYFEKAKIDAIYGSSVTLPLRARYAGKPIAINSSDVTITLSAPAAGKIEGFNFVAAESSVKTLTITAALNENAKASINVMLYKQGENSFDFDKATGGDRMLAWHREVSNSNIEDGNIYNVIDPTKDMVTSYTFALDMTAIPVPERLEELTYMLPGGTMEGTNAWTFLTSLAQRISDMSWVKATIDFDDRFVVDYSELKILNDYFTMKGIELDETTNTLTLTMQWIKQSQVIDAATANPLCLINGLKLTPKEGVWEDTSKINVVTSGTIGYEIYMRASGLYGFAQKPESQAVFGVYPYRNPNDTSDAGGYFRDTYVEIVDEYTLVNAVKEGWVNEDGGFAYYIEGERLTGVQQVEGYYYDFGENGVNVGQTKLTGLFFDETANAYRYSYLGELASGWQSIDGEWYYFSTSTMNAAVGRVRIGGIYYDFEENGKLVSGVWVNTLHGVRYYYGPSYQVTKWREIDGEMYYFRDGYRVTGIQRVSSQENTTIRKYYDFGEDGIAREIEDGLLIVDGNINYVIDGRTQIGLHKVDGDYYFFTYDGPAIVGKIYYAWETHCDLPCGNYAFGTDGKMINGMSLMEDGYYYYYVNGKLNTDSVGLTKLGDDYYFIDSYGKAVTGARYAWKTNCDLPCSNYEFGADGKMLQGIVQKADGVYYYKNGKISSQHVGLTKLGDDYYFIDSYGKAVTGARYAWKTNCDLPCDNYEFGADGKMLQGIVVKDDATYYYVNGKPATKYPGLTKVGNDYYFIDSYGKAVTGSRYAWSTNCDLPCDTYEFGTDGKMLQGIVVKDTGIYYYINGEPATEYPGLTKIGDDYYFIDSYGKAVSGSRYAWATNCDLPCDTYEFGADGKMLHGIVEKEDGIYCYVYGKMGGNPGLIKIESDYYFVNSSGKVVTGNYYCWTTNCDLPVGTYEFGPDGKMYNGFVTKGNSIYYYVDGKIGKVGLNYIDGCYYFVTSSGKLIVNQTYYVWETNGLLLEKDYTFNELGQIIG